MDITDEEIIDQAKADAVMAGLLGGAMSTCPSCGQKILSTAVNKDDVAHPDQHYRCPHCEHRWVHYVPEGLTSDTTEAGVLMVPFDNFGNQHHVACGRMRPNEVFTDTLVFDRISRSRYSYSFVFTRRSTGCFVYMMRLEFEACLRLMILGEITGTFTFRRRGQGVGVCLHKEKVVRPKKAPKPAKARKRVTRIPLSSRIAKKIVNGL